MPRDLDPTYVRIQVDLLRSAAPDIWQAGDDVLVGDMLEAETGLFPFLGALVNRAHEASYHAGGLDSLITDLQWRRERLKMRSDQMRELAFKLMQYAGVTTVQLPQATLSIRTGVPKVVITDEAQLPDDCFRVKREIDKLNIRRKIDAGERVDGAHLSNAEPSLTVRIK